MQAKSANPLDDEEMNEASDKKAKANLSYDDDNDEEGNKKVRVPTKHIDHLSGKTGDKLAAGAPTNVMTDKIQPAKKGILDGGRG